MSIRMGRIISVSRRTDVPAFYGDWFMSRLKAGFVGYVNPFSGQKHIVSLKPHDVLCFVFWSKNFEPFTKNLKVIEDMGYRFYLHYTITNLPSAFECNVIDSERAIRNLKRLSKLFSLKRISWRYDPIVISDITDYKFHKKNFERLAKALEGYVERCYFHYVNYYEKVKRNTDLLQKRTGIRVIDPDIRFQKELASELAEIASKNGITMFSCCSDYLAGDGIKRASCIDGALIEELFNIRFEHERKPTRPGCGCTESTDIGAYDTCPHACIYCYANLSKKVAHSKFKKHDKSSAFLGYTGAESDMWIKDTKERYMQSPVQIELF